MLKTRVPTLRVRKKKSIRRRARRRYRNLLPPQSTSAVSRRKNLPLRTYHQNLRSRQPKETMAEKATTTHKKIYQIAKEINISHETLLEYLRRKGHDVRSHMSAVDDTMMHDILSHFKKDKE